MLALENADEILQILDRFTKQKSKDIPPELEEYINYVAKSGDTVYRWPTVQYLFREKLRNVIKDFHDTTASIEDLPQCPNVDQFNYESMKTLLFERFDNFQAAPFTIQRLCELLTDPKKHYTRLDKFMRALEKNILVVSTVEPGRKNVDGNDESINDDIMQDINIDIEISKGEDKKITNGTSDKHNDHNSNEHKVEEVPSGSGTSQSSPDVDVKKEESTDVAAAPAAADKQMDTEQSIDSSEPQKSTEELEVKPVKEESVEPKPDNATEEATTAKDESVAPKAETESSETDEKNDSTPAVEEPKVESVQENTPAVADKDEIEAAKETPPTVETSEIEKPPTPKHARSSSGDEDDGENDKSSNPCAKKIRLELDEEVKDEAKPDPEPSNEPIVPEVESPKENVVSNAKNENDNSEKAVDVAVEAKKESISKEAEPIVEEPIEKEAAKPTEEKTATEVATKPEEPATSIPSDLEFTPDEALNELVSSDILSVIPEQPVVEEVKMSEEAANITEPVAPADEMTVENAESNPSEAENAMEAAPIKADEEQMDVDESNSVDAMDL